MNTQEYLKHCLFTDGYIECSLDRKSWFIIWLKWIHPNNIYYKDLPKNSIIYIKDDPRENSWLYCKEFVETLHETAVEYFIRKSILATGSIKIALNDSSFCNLYKPFEDPKFSDCLWVRDPNTKLKVIGEDRTIYVDYQYFKEILERVTMELTTPIPTNPSLVALRTAIDNNPGDWNLRGIYAEALEEHGGDNLLIEMNRWLCQTQRTPLALPYEDKYAFIMEGDTTLINHTIPKTTDYEEPFSFDAIRCKYAYAKDSLFYDVNHLAPYYTKLKRVELLDWKPVQYPPEVVGGFFHYELTLDRQAADQEDYVYASRSLTKTSITDTIKDLQNQLNPGNMFVRCIFANWHIPCLDIDDGSRFEETTSYLNRNCIPHAVFISSPKPQKNVLTFAPTYNKYWIICDAASPYFFTAAYPFDGLKSCDPKYWRISKQRECFYLRGEKKTAFTPYCIYNNIKSPLVKRFVELFEKHWQDQRLEEIRTLRATISQVTSPTPESAYPF